jgi:chromosome segregation ATPase
VAGERLLAKLRSARALQAAEAEQAQEALTQALFMREQVRELPTILARRSAIEARTEAAEKDCSQLRLTVEARRAELEATSNSTGARAQALAEKVGHLERECHELQDFISSSPGNLDVATDFAAEGASTESALARAQESNRRLLTEVRDARAAREAAVAEQERLEGEVARVRSEVGRQRRDARLEQKNVELEAREEEIAELQRDVCQKREEVLELKRRAAETRGNDEECVVASSGANAVIGYDALVQSASARCPERVPETDSSEQWSRWRSLCDRSLKRIPPIQANRR